MMEEALDLVTGEDDDGLFRKADEVRREFCGDEVHLRGLIEFSNHCVRNCLYCGLRRNNSSVKRYRMDPSEIAERALAVIALGLRTIVLQSGEDPWYTADSIAGIVRTIKKNSDAALTLSIGERSRREYEIMRQAGADRFLLKHETANPDLYARCHPDMSFSNRVRCIRDLKDLGYQVGVGNLVGLPDQTYEDLISDILFAREIGAEMIGVGPFIPHPGTPFKDASPGTLSDTLRAIALTRIMLKTPHIPATTAIGTIHPRGREMALGAGANVVMPNFTPGQYRGHYEIYPARRCIDEDGEKCLPCIKGMIESLGRSVARGRGDGPNLGPPR
jgi:biotin synthase